MSASIHFRLHPVRCVRPPIGLGDRLTFAGDKRPYRVRGIAAGGRFVIATKPFNLRHTVLYTVVDFDEGRRGPDNRIFGAGYETDEQIAQRVEDFTTGDYEVSVRRDVRLDLVAVNGHPVRCEPVNGVAE